MNSAVIIDFELEGFHYYPGAPKKVAFLEHMHRHMFQFVVKYKVSDLDREKEIFIETDRIKLFLELKYGQPCKFRAMSCEMIAKVILEHFAEQGVYYVKVLEDGKGGAECWL